MSRGTNRQRQRARSRTLSNEHAPRSMAAAQIMNNMPEGQTPATTDRALFEQLLLEILGNENGVSDSQQEKDLGTNSELIQVVTKAGLDVLLQDQPLNSPFDSAEDLLPSARKSLAVISLCIRRAPLSLLETVSEPDHNGLRPQPSVLFRLLSKLAYTTIHPRGQKLHEDVLEVLVICISSILSIPQCAEQALNLVRYIKACIQDLVKYIDHSVLKASTGHSHGGVKVPSSQTLTNLFSIASDASYAQSSVKIPVRNFEKATGLSLVLMKAFIEASQSVQSSLKPHFLLNDDIWILDSLTRMQTIWQSIKGGRFVSESRALVHTRSIVRLALLILGSKAGEKPCGFAQVKAAQLLMLCVSQLVSYSLTSKNEIQEDLLVSLRGLLTAAEKPMLPKELLRYQLVPTLCRLVDQSSYDSFMPELKRCVHTCVNLSLDAFASDLTSDERKLAETLEAHASHLVMDVDSLSATPEVALPLRKRPRLSQNSSPPGEEVKGCYEDILSDRLCSVQKSIDNSTSRNFNTIGDINRYFLLSESEQCDVLKNIGLLACAGAGPLLKDLNRVTGESIELCRTCDHGVPRLSVAIETRGKFHGILHQFLSQLIRAANFRKTAKPRIYAAQAIRRFYQHNANHKYLDLQEDPIAQWCIDLNRSSVRELRLAAGRLLPIFLYSDLYEELEEGMQESLIQRNRRLTVDYLQVLLEKDDLSLQETAVLSWSQLCRMSSEEHFGITLKKLVEQLGHPNPLIHGTVYNELVALATSRKLSPDQLISSYWNLIADGVVAVLHSRPQVAQSLCDFVGCTVTEFLIRTQIFTLPWLVLGSRHDTLRRIAQARNDDSTIFSMCFDDRGNMAAIVALLLIQPFPSLEEEAFDMLKKIDPQFGELEELAELVESDGLLIAHRLLIMAGDAGEQQAVKIHKAFRPMADMYYRRLKHPILKQKKSNLVGQFFDTNVLGIMTHFADVINDAQRVQPMAEKLRSLRGMREMIKIAKSNICSGLPQISACLHAALEQEQSRDLALAIWIIMMKAIDEEEVESLLGSTFSVIIKYWSVLNSTSKTSAVQYIQYLFKNCRSAIEAQVASIPTLADIPELRHFEEQLKPQRGTPGMHQVLLALTQRCQHDNATVVGQALIELERSLEKFQSQLPTVAIREQPDSILPTLVRVILDATIKYNTIKPEIAKTGSRCLGLIGSLDYNRFEIVREKRETLVLSNFENVDECIDFLIVLLEDFLIKGYLSATNTKSQGFYAFVMQEALRFCGLSSGSAHRTREREADQSYRRWVSLSESDRSHLAPFLDSRYILTVAYSRVQTEHPIFAQKQVSYSTWLRIFLLDLMEKGVGENARKLFPVLVRAVQPQETAVASFLLPYVVANVISGGTDEHRKQIKQELMAVLTADLDTAPYQYATNIRLCSETIFSIIDYLSRWMQERRKLEVSHDSGDSMNPEIERVASLLAEIPADVVAHRAIECQSYAWALFHWEQHIRAARMKLKQDENGSTLEQLYERLQQIYAQIDEPDGIEGISAHIHVLNEDQQLVQHRKAGRWSAAQSWYELQLSEQPNDLEAQANLLTCLRESGQHEVLLSQIDGWYRSDLPNELITSLAMEAAWITGKWTKIANYLNTPLAIQSSHFNIGIGGAFIALRNRDAAQFKAKIEKLRSDIAGSLSVNGTASLQDWHEPALRLHMLTEVEMISGIGDNSSTDKADIINLLTQRLEVLGTFMADKQRVLALRRATMQLSCLNFSNDELATVWLTSAKLARKVNSINLSFNCVLHASHLGAPSSTIEHAKILWHEGNHRNAIQTLQGAIAAGFFGPSNIDQAVDESATTFGPGKNDRQNLLVARAHLLLAKWLDYAGQTHSQSIIERYHVASRLFTRWAKGHYHLGKHYNKILDLEKARQPNRQSQAYITGETTKLVVGNYLRSLAYGSKYIFQTLPKLLTLWLELGMEVDKPINPKCGSGEKFRTILAQNRLGELEMIHRQLGRYVEKLPAFVFYTALPHLVARICHPRKDVYELLEQMILKVVWTHPQHAMWTLLAVEKSSDNSRRKRGARCISKVTQLSQKKHKALNSSGTFSNFVNHAQRLSGALLDVCNGEIQGKVTKVSLERQLGFIHVVAPCQLVVPVESTLTASLPTLTDNMASHKAFSQELNTISTFADEVTVLNSLQKPKKLSVRGTNGKWYGLLCKPKDDLRKDQRLMEFNTMINGALKKDAESSRRRLYIKTYAVTPLNEECGLIEWVDNLKTYRDIVVRLYQAKKISINYPEIRGYLDVISADPDREEQKFQSLVLNKFPPVFHEWFVEMFPEPNSWFAARLRYTRSCAVMSMVGMVLGLGDRHGENILFEEGNGGTFHVDFNCLFEKGLTLVKPELVPFRLTHNMVDAFGVQGVEGPFRKSCELTLDILRQNEDTLMTILETFLHDPTTDLIGKRKSSRPGVPDTPQEVLDSVRSKVRGLLQGESVPLSVDGHVQELIQQAISHANLARMYVGWCSFL